MENHYCALCYYKFLRTIILSMNTKEIFTWSVDLWKSTCSMCNYWFRIILCSTNTCKAFKGHRSTTLRQNSFGSYWFWYWYWICKTLSVHIGIGIAKHFWHILVLVLLLQNTFGPYWYCYWYCKTL